MRRSGFTIIELMAVMVITVAISGALLVFFVDTFQNDRIVQGVNEADKGAREQLDILVDHLRNAQQYDSGATYGYRAIAAGTATSVTYYVDDTGKTIKYYLSNGQLRRDATSISEGDTLVFDGITNLEFTYLKAKGNSYYTDIQPTADPNEPKTVELGLLAQVDISITITIDGQPRTLFSEVRLRNSPRKERL